MDIRAAEQQLKERKGIRHEKAKKPRVEKNTVGKRQKVKRVGQRKFIPQKGFNAGKSDFLDMCAAINQYRIVCKPGVYRFRSFEEAEEWLRTRQRKR